MVEDKFQMFRLVSWSFVLWSAMVWAFRSRNKLPSNGGSHVPQTQAGGNKTCLNGQVQERDHVSFKHRQHSAV